MQYRNLIVPSALSLALLSLSACEGKEKSGKVRVAMQSASSEAFLRGINVTDGYHVSSDIWNWANFTPVSLLVPIHYIRLDNEIVYRCEGDEDSCLVDLMDQSSVDKVTGEVEVTEGAYNTVSINHCLIDSEGPTNRLKGSFSAGGVTYYTVNEGAGLTTDVAKYDYVDISHTGCSTSYPIRNGVNVEADAELKIALIYTATDIAYGGPTSPQPSEVCLRPDDTPADVCLSYPDVIPVVGDRTILVENYIITVESGEKGLLQLVLEDDELLGGFTRHYYDATSNAAKSFVTPLSSFSKNTDGTYEVRNGPGMTGGVTVDALLTIENLQRSDHNGSLVMAYGGAPTTVTYSAIKN